LPLGGGGREWASRGALRFGRVQEREEEAEINAGAVAWVVAGSNRRYCSSRSMEGKLMPVPASDGESEMRTLQ